MSGKPDSIPYQEIVGLLNEVVGSRYRATSEATKRLIRARWKEGHRVPDFESVIRGRHALWAKDEKMAEYLRPSTLFGTKFESYLNANGVKAKRPIREVDRWA